MTTFIQPDYTIGNSADCQTQMIGVLQGLDQALQALQPSPATNVVQFNNSILLAEPASSNTNTMSNGLIVMSDGSNSSTATATTFNLTDNSGDIQLNESLYSIDFQNNNTSSYCQMGTLTQNSGLNGIEAFNGSISTYFKLSTDIIPNNPSLALLDGNGVLGVISASAIMLDGSPAGLHTDITLKDGINTSALGVSALLFSDISIGNVITIDATTKQIIITDGTITNTINKNGYTTKNTSANATHYLNFSDSSSTGTGAIQKTAGISCNPSTNTITATTFSGTATTATNATNVGLTSDNTSGTYYIPFAKTSGTGNKPLYIDDTTGPLTYNPSTATLSATAYTITGTPATASVASTFGQVGLVYLGAVQVAITGSASAQNLSFANLFNSSYKNYRITLTPTTQVSFTAYPSYSLQAFLGTSVPTIASLYGWELTSASSASMVVAYTAGATISSAPLLFAVSSLTNKQVMFDIKNVGFANTSTQVVELNCKSIYGNPGVSGASDRTITCSSLSGATITGLVIQQTSIGVGNNFTLEATIYGYNNI